MSSLVENRETEKDSFRIGNISSMEEIMGNEPSIKQKFIAECLGTLLLVFIACGVGDYSDFQINPTSVAGGLVVTGLVYVFQKVSGAHFNPAVSLAMCIIKKITLKEFFYYFGAQFIGSMIGSALVAFCRKGKFDILGSTKIGDYLLYLNDTKERKLDTWCYISALFCEIFITFILIIVVLASTVKKNNYNNLTGLVVGLTLIFLIYTGFYVSGSSMNPVRSFAPAFFEAVVDGNTTAIKQIWIYIAGPFIGSSFAVLLYLNIYN